MQLDYGTNIPDPIETCTSRSTKKIIPQGYLSQFKSRTRSEVNTYELGYDYGSIMHYNQKAFSKNGRNTIDIGLKEAHTSEELDT